jgi:hypothetical protein
MKVHAATWRPVGEPAVGQQHDIPADIGALAGMRADYVDLFTATAPAARDSSPEEWARTAMEGASAFGRFLCWQVLLGLRLDHRASADRIAGWQIVERGPDWIRAAARSWCLTAHVVIHLDDEHLSLATFVRYDRRPAAQLWSAVSVVHRAAAPDLLRAAVRRVARGGGYRIGR